MPCSTTFTGSVSESLSLMTSGVYCSSISTCRLIFARCLQGIGCPTTPQKQHPKGESADCPSVCVSRITYSSRAVHSAIPSFYVIVFLSRPSALRAPNYPAITTSVRKLELTLLSRFNGLPDPYAVLRPILLLPWAQMKVLQCVPM